MPSLTPQQTFDLAVQQQRAGRLSEARELCRQLLAAYPESAGTLHLLGLFARQSGAPAEAVDWLRRAIAAQPADAALHNDLGVVWHALGRLAEAVAAYRKALELQPNSAAILNNLANGLKDQSQLDEALAAYREAIRLDPGIAEIHSNFASALRENGQLGEAIAAAHRAIALKPAYAMAYNNLGHALLDDHQVREAMAAFHQALRLQPQFALAHNNLGTAHKALGEEDEAIAAYQQALAAEPGHVLALGNLANAWYERGDLGAALPLYQRAVESPRGTAAMHSNYLAVLQYWPQTTLPSLAAAHDLYERRFAQPLRASARPFPGPSEPDRPLRLGFISPYFGIHPVGFFLVRLLENLDRRQFQAICYLDSARDDAMTARLRAAAAEWHPVANDSDEQLAQRVRHDRIDILVDLAGHTGGNRLPVFARQPAPIQITWLDYVGTTGLSAIDYILADPRQIPPEAELFYREKVLRLPHDYICFDPPATAPDAGPLPATANGFVTFASFNIVPKTTPQVVEAWGRILRQIPNARLILKNRRFDHPAVIARYRSWFAGQSVDPDRISFQGWSSSSRTARRLPASRSRAGHFSLQRRTDHLRSSVDGRARGHLPRRNIRQPARSRAFDRRRTHGDHRPRPR